MINSVILKDHCRNRDSDRPCGSWNRIEGHPLVLRALVTTKSWPKKICTKVLGLQDPPCSQTLYVVTAFDILPLLYSWRRFLSYFNCKPYYQNQIEASRGSNPLTICKCQWIPRCDKWSVEEQRITSIQELLGFYQASFYREKMHYLLESDPRACLDNHWISDNNCLWTQEWLTTMLIHLVLFCSWSPILVVLKFFADGNSTMWLSTTSIYRSCFS